MPRVREDRSAEERLRTLTDALASHLADLERRAKEERGKAAATADPDSYLAAATRGKAKGLNDSAQGLLALMYKHRLTNRAPAGLPKRARA